MKAVRGTRSPEAPSCRVDGDGFDGTSRAQVDARADTWADGRLAVANR
ncbi:hypothetical protein ACFYZI_32205 [Streptomyces griseorubiginosus]|nr:hypothetical protein [Streptomyces sp. BK205]